MIIARLIRDDQYKLWRLHLHFPHVFNTVPLELVGEIKGKLGNDASYLMIMLIVMVMYLA